MAQAELADVLKGLKTSLSSASDNKVHETFEKLSKVIQDENSGFVAQYLKGVFRCMVLSLGQQYSHASRHSALQLINVAKKKYPDNVAKHFVDASKEFCEKQSTCRYGTGALDWLNWSSCLVSLAKSDRDVLTSLIKCQAQVNFSVRMFSKPSVEASVERIWKRILDQCPDVLDEYVTVLSSGENPTSLVTLSSLVQAAESKSLSNMEGVKNKLVDLTTKVLFSIKTRPSADLMVLCSSLFACCSHENFESNILPTIKRYMLRSPELSLFIATEYIRFTKLDLSKYAEELSAILTAEAKCKEEERRKEAVRGFKFLAEHCSNPDSVNLAMQQIFNVLVKGQGGKVTVIAERMDLISAAGLMASCPVSGTQAKSSIAVEAMKQFSELLKQETNESTIVHAVNELCNWVKLSPTSIPKELSERLQIGCGPKTASTAVRQAYLFLVYKCLTTADALSFIQAMESTLMTTLNTASNQPLQITLVTEGLFSAVLLLRLSKADLLSNDKVDQVSKLLLNATKQMFTNEKFLASVSEFGLQALISLAEFVVVQWPEKIKDDMTFQYLSVIVYAACHNKHSMRKSAQVSIMKIVSGLGGYHLALVMLACIEKLLEKQNWLEYFDENVEQKNPTLTAKGFTEALNSITSLSGDKKELTQIVIASLIPSHHRAIASFKQDAWLNIIAKFKLSPKDLVDQNLAAMTDILLANDDPKSSKTEALKTLIRINGCVVVPYILSKCKELLGDQELTYLTSEQFNIYLWPEGELYDISVIEKNKENEDVRNLRRENKLYSYKDQLMEIELRKELEAKRKAEGKLVEKLTPKQMEAKKNQLKLESEIRAKVKQLDEKVKQASAALHAVCTCEVQDIAHYLSSVCDMIVPLVKYPVTAAHLTDVLIKAIQSALGNKHLGEMIAVLTLRIYEAACQLPKQWINETLVVQRDRVINVLLSASPLTASAFACCFPLLKLILEKENLNDGQRQDILKIFDSHTQLRSELETDGPAILPRCEMLKLLVNVVDTSAKKVSSSAASVLLHLCQSASGQDGCTLAESDEIEVLLDALKMANFDIRRNALMGMIELIDALPTPDSDPSLGYVLMRRLWIAKFDTDEAVKKLADQLWDELGLELETSYATEFLDDVVSNIETIRQSSTHALTELLESDGSQTSKVVDKALSVYQEKLHITPAVMDNFGRVKSEQSPDQWRARSGIALLLKSIASLLKKDDIGKLMSFYVPDALHDRNEQVALMMRHAAVHLIEYHGKTNVETLLPVLEKSLSSLPNTASYDVVKQGVIVLMGNLAKHLDKDDSRVKPIVAKLIASLSVPSQQVQEAVAECLPPLVPSIKDEVRDIITKLIQLLLSSDKYAERRGAAYGLAGIVKGSGILVLKQLDIMTTLSNAVQNKKNALEREGALFAFEMLSNMLGKLFEPYIVHVLPFLLVCYGDSNQHVRAAANDTARVVMSQLSAHGVKLVLPVLLTALNEDHWRTKSGSVELLGSMAFCAPKQLSACLPQIVPKLVEVLADSHDKVRASGALALQHIGEVIKNPEIQSIVPILLEALRNPSHHTTSCLQTLLETQFVHFIDSPSLALIMPVVTRAIEDRSTETRKMACQIIGNMYSLTDQKDLSPYMTNIMPGIKKSLVDPVPDVRSMSARALGAMVRGMGEQAFNDLQPWLVATLISEDDTVNRSGAAQGLSEVIGALGFSKLQHYVDVILNTANRTDLPPYHRDGYIMMFVYLPAVFGDQFVQFVGPILPTILKALADECEYVRETGLKAGLKIINMFADKSIELLLPELEKGLFDENWRIRLSSVQLLGDLLYKVSGVSGKMSTETAHDDDNFGTELSQQVIVEILGLERRNRVLSGLYMGRSDTALLVRQASLHVWKVIVSNTPKTLRDILPTLFSLLLGCLACTSYDKREIAARTLGDVVKKLGERVLPEILPILGVGLESTEADKRQGVCIGLSEIMKSTSKEQVMGYSDNLIPTVSRALSDPVGSVRQAAAKTFDSLHSSIGTRALEEILPDLLLKLNNEATKDYALDGLQQVMAVKSFAVLPYIVPRLTSEPVNTKALSILASVAGPALDKELHRILEALSGSLASKLGTAAEEEELKYCTAVVLSIQTDVALRTVIEISLRLLNNQNPKIQASSALILNAFCSNTKLDYEAYLQQLFRALISILVNKDERLLDACWECINSIVKALDSSHCMQQVPLVKQAIKYAASDLKGEELLPGFCLPKKGITCLLPVFREGLLNGTPELKESSALGLSEAIKLTSSEALKPSVVNITGPLIRVLGDRYGPSVRVSMLETINILLIKCGPLLKPFIPQLQTTFVKALNDPARPVRMKAAEAMAQLIIIHTRVDPVFTELSNGVKNYEEDISVRETYLHALRLCLVAGASKMAPATRQDTTKLLTGYMAHTEDSVRILSAAGLGALLSALPSEERTDVIINHILNTKESDWKVTHARCVALFVSLKESADALLEGDKYREEIINILVNNSSSDKIPVAQFGIRGLAMLLKKVIESGGSLDKRLIIAIGKAMKIDSNDIKQLIGQSVEFISRVANSKSDDGLEESCIKILLPHLINGSREKNTAVKSASDYALIAMLQLRKSMDLYNKILSSLEAGKSESLEDVFTKNLKKALKLAEPKEEEFDVTLLV